MKTSITIPMFLFSFIVLLIGCKTPPPTAEQPVRGEEVYYNSFESPGDTSGWGGYMRFTDDAPPPGGNHSAFISGGCIIPHAYVTIVAPSYDTYLILRCWGKNLSNGGEIRLIRKNDWGGAITILINDTTWTRYQSADELFCPAGDTLSLELTSGGFIGSSMLIDLIEVVRVG
jgi:hypothetical protein